MPTLLSINNYHYIRGGAEYVYLEHNQIFRSAGWQVVPFSMRHPDNKDTEWERFFVDEIELDREYSGVTRLKKAFKAIYSREARSKVGRLVEEIAPNVAHCHNIYHHISPSILPELHSRGVPIVITLHDLKIACPAYRMITHDGICERCRGGRIWNAALHKCMHGSTALSAWVSVEAAAHRLLRSYDHVDRFVVPSRFYLEKFVEWGWPRERFEHVPNFVDTGQHEPNTEPGNYYLYFGRLSHEKGVRTFIQACAASGTRGCVVGGGPLDADLRREARELAADIEFTGFLSGEALFSRIRMARAVVLPSEWYENAPISVLEAFALGKPVIGSDIGGIPELIGQERGVVFEPFSSSALSSALSGLSSMPDDAISDMGAAARHYVETEHSRERYFDRCAQIYTELSG